MGWHYSVIVRISHDPVKEKYHFSQQQWSAVNHSATITGPSRDNLNLWAWVLEHLEHMAEGGREHQRRKQGGWGMCGPGLGKASTCWHCLFGQSQPLQRNLLWEESWSLVSFWATTLLCYKSGIAYNRHFRVEEHVLCCQKELLWVSSPTVY